MMNQKKFFLFASAGLLWFATLAWLYHSNIKYPNTLPLSEEGQAIEEAGDPQPMSADLVVDLDDRMSPSEIETFRKKLSIELIGGGEDEDPHHIYQVLFIGEKGISTTARLQFLLNRLRQQPEVEAADFDLLYSIPESSPNALTRAQDEGLSISNSNLEKARVAPNDPMYQYQWHMDQIKMPDAWQLSQGQDVVVAVIDTGVTRVEDLQGTEFVPGWNFINATSNAEDDHGHGTHVAGTIAQTTNNGIGVTGIAYKAKIMPIKVLSGSGSGSVAGIATGIRWAADHEANVINMSLGGPMNSTVLAKAVAYAHDKGVLVVCAAGNEGKGRVSFPAANRGAIAVAATQFDETTTFYSNWGKEITIAAPGGNTRVDQNQDGVPDGVMQNTVTPGNIGKQDYLLFMGTSMASPHVAGVAALIYSAGVRDPDQVTAIIQATAHKPARYQGRNDPHYGAGIIDAAAAVQKARMDQSL